nr:MAG TPA: hypothetical protein [Caudoviricetes sp.]
MREVGEMTKEQERERLNREIWALPCFDDYRKDEINREAI